MKIRKILNNFSYSVFANIVSMIISFITIAIIPKIIGVTEYGYVQIYLFYVSYVVFFRFGHADGIYLKYGGSDYDTLDKKILVSQFWFVMFLDCIITILIIWYSITFVQVTEKAYVLILVGINILVVIPKTLLQIILQATNKIREYSISIIIERVLYGIFIIVLVFIKINNFKIIILTDLIAKTISFFLVIIYCKDIVIGKFSNLKIALFEFIDNIKIGINLMLSNIASLAIIGVVRLIIEKKWSIDTFAKISLILSISNMLMTFISAIGVVIYPILKNIEKDKLSYIYTKVKDVLIILVLGIFITYFPIKEILLRWLREYGDSIKYMALLFPICVYESKMAMIIVPYFNSLRLEKILLNINFFILILTTISSSITALIFNNLEATVLVITVSLAVRCCLCEMKLSDILNKNIKKDLIIENIIILLFMIICWNLKSWLGIIIYFFVYLLFIYTKKKYISDLVKILNYILKK